MFRIKFRTIKVALAIFLIFVLVYWNLGRFWEVSGKTKMFESMAVDEVSYIHQAYNEEYKHSAKYANRPWIYAITPTFFRLEQKAELTRLSQTIMNVPNFHWIVVEDSSVKTPLVTKLLKRKGIHYTHLNIVTPYELVLRGNEPHWLKPRGVMQRNAGLKWLRDNHRSVYKPAVVYFMDDDNTYDIDLFDEMRWTKEVSVWHVGFTGGLRYEGPKCKDGKVVGWFAYWKPERPFPLDMAGFAVNLRLILKNRNAKFSGRSPHGYQESYFLSHITSTDKLEPRGNCTEILAWHTRTLRYDLHNEGKMKAEYGYGSDMNVEV